MDTVAWMEAIMPVLIEGTLEAKLCPVCTTNTLHEDGECMKCAWDAKLGRPPSESLVEPTRAMPVKPNYTVVQAAYLWCRFCNDHRLCHIRSGSKAVCGGCCSVHELIPAI